VKIRVNGEMCQGHAACHAHGGDLYPLDEFGYSSLDVAEVPAGMEELARRGAAACPEMAISIEE
jgi:ferredoxin